MQLLCGSTAVVRSGHLGHKLDPVDLDWAKHRLEDYLGICDRIDAHLKSISQTGQGWDDFCSASNHQAELKLPAVERIVREAYPAAPQPLMPPSYSTQDSAHWIRRALGAVTDQAEIDAHLRPTAPVLFADGLHGWIWEAAVTVWDTGQYAAGLQQASTALSARIRTRASSPLRDRKLVAQVFSPDAPKRDSPRLHIPGEPNDEAWQARQSGLHLMAQGAFAGIRNVAAHEDPEWSEQEALELLCVLSTVARWTDTTELRTC